MAGKHELSRYDSRYQMGYSISETRRIFDIPELTASIVYQEYLMKSITGHCAVHSGQPLTELK